jgi:hypothetical protein
MMGRNAAPAYCLMHGWTTSGLSVRGVRLRGSIGPTLGGMLRFIGGAEDVGWNMGLGVLGDTMVVSGNGCCLGSLLGDGTKQ